MLDNQNIKNSDISIILLLYNTPEKKLKNLSNYKDFNILILDQSNDLITKEKVSKILPKIIYYKVTDKNNGFAKGINFLSKKIKTKFFLCTQIDVLINKKSIIELKKAFLRKRDCAISIPNFDKKKKSNFIIKINRFTGAIFLAEKSKFNKIGGFDENFFFYWEDEDFSRRLQNFKRLNIYKCMNSIAKHNNGNSTLVSPKTNYIRLSNFKFGELYFQSKYKELKIVKILREPIKKVILIFFYLFTFQIKLFYKQIYILIGIIKFYKFKFLEIIKFF